MAMSNKNEVPQVSITPEEDARLPILEAQIEREWCQHRSGYVKSLKRAGTLKKQLRETALACIRVLHQYQNAGLNPDQGREAMGVFIHPQWDRS
jgi:hypothetical protein